MIREEFFVISGRRQSDWVLNALAKEGANIRIGNLAFQVSVHVASPRDEDQVLDLYVTKYGSRIVKEWYSRPDTFLVLRPLGPPSKTKVPSEVDATQEFEQWRQERPDYYQAVNDAFNSAADDYDYTISHNFINTWIRKRSIRELLDVATREDVLLEIGCGTGAEAVEICKHVKGIVATDVSERMLEIFSKKVHARRLSGKISVTRARASEIGKVRRLLPKGSVRIAYSFNGALNCEPQIHEVPIELASIIQPNGYFLCSVRNTLCVSEMIAHAVSLQFDKLDPRKKQPLMVSVGGLNIPAYYYSPWTFQGLFQQYFRLEKTIGLPSILPPAYLNEYYLKLRRATSVLERIDQAISRFTPFNKFGDQTLFVFRRRD